MATSTHKFRRRLVKLILYAIFGVMMFISNMIMSWMPNVHMASVLLVIFTVVFRAEALIPLYVCVALYGLFYGFSLWWIPYLYIWLPLWAVVMLLPRNMTPAVAALVYMVVCAVHGLLFGVLYAPFQALIFEYSFAETLAWIATGLWFDILHGIGNFCLAVLVLPLSRALLSMKRKYIDSI